MRNIILIWIIGGLGVLAQQNSMLTLDECYKQATINQPYYKNKQLVSDAGELKNRNINTNWYPQLNLSGQATYQSDALNIKIPIPSPNPVPTFKSIEGSHDQYKVFADINQVIYDGGAIKAQKLMSQASTNTDMSLIEVDLLNLKQQINNTYFSLLILNQNEELMNSIKGNLLQKQKTIDAAVASGILMPTDKDIIRIEVLKIEQQLTDIALNKKAVLEGLSELVGMPIAETTKLTIPESIAIENDSLQRPEIKMFESQRNNFDNSIKFSSSQRLPKIYAFYQAGYGKPGLNMMNNEFDTYYIAGLTVKWNIWDWNKTSREKQTMAIQKDIVNNKQEVFLRNIRTLLNNSQSRILQLQQALKTDSVIVEMRTRVTKTSSTRLEQGIITTTDYINDLNAENQSKIQFETHKLQLLQAEAEYRIVMGR